VTNLIFPQFFLNASFASSHSTFFYFSSATLRTFPHQSHFIRPYSHKAHHHNHNSPRNGVGAYFIFRVDDADLVYAFVMDTFLQ
jgi:hypothetical protein